MKEHFKFAVKVAVALVIVFGVCDLVAKFAGINVKNFILSPAASLGLGGSTTSS